MIEFTLILRLHLREPDLIITGAQYESDGEMDSEGKSRRAAVCSVSNWFVKPVFLSLLVAAGSQRRFTRMVGALVCSQNGQTVWYSRPWAWVVHPALPSLTHSHVEQSACGWGGESGPRGCTLTGKAKTKVSPGGQLGDYYTGSKFSLNKTLGSSESYKFWKTLEKGQIGIAAAWSLFRRWPEANKSSNAMVILGWNP